MKAPALGNAGQERGSSAASLARAKSVAELVRNLSAAARNLTAAARMNQALQRAAICDDRPRDHLREYSAARQVDRRLEPYLRELNRYAERRESQVRRD